jgi:hypothetical protein
MLSISRDDGEGKDMEEKPQTNVDLKAYLEPVLSSAIKVIIDPVSFFKEMPRSGGYVEPAVFIAVMGVVAGVIQTLFGLLGFRSYGDSLGMVFFKIVLIPVFSVIFCFAGAAIFYAIWRALGSEHPYETSYRCAAYMTAISPLLSLLHVIPYLGTLAGIGWMTYLIVVASMEVHSVEMRKAWIVFGAIGAVLALGALSSEYSARQIMGSMHKLDKQMEDMKNMTPEEAGKKMGEFLKGLEEGAGKKK